MFLRMSATALLFATIVGLASAEPVKTSKERLSDKAADEQRVDNCRVAPERRGTVARPDCQPDAAAAPVSTPPQTPPGR
jgi:hypothetical protein